MWNTHNFLQIMKIASCDLKGTIVRFNGLLLISIFTSIMSSGVQAAFAAESSGTIRYFGQVVDGAGQPVDGARVEFHQYPEKKPGPVFVTNLTTGAEGRFEAEVAREYTHLVVQKNGKTPGWYTVSPYTTNRAQITLLAPSSLAGIVVDEAGKPVSDAEVYVSVAHTGNTTDYKGFLGGKLTRKFFSTRTDGSGHFRISNFPTNSLAELGVSVPGKVLPPRQAQYSPKSLLCHSGQEDIRLVLEPSVEIEGRIVTETGESVTNARVELRSVGSMFDVPWEPRQQVTNGAFRFSGISSGAYQIFGVFGTNRLADWVAEPVLVEVRAGQNVRNVELKASKGGVLMAQSIDKRTGKPIDEVDFNVRVGDHSLYQSSDTNGQALFRVLPGKYQVGGDKSGFLYRSSEVQVDLAQTNQVTLEFMSPPVVSGIVRDASGKPAAGLNVWLHSEWPHVERKTDANGRYEVIHKEDPQLVLVVDPVRHVAAASDLEEGVTNLDLQIAPALTLVGRVEDSTGQPVTNANLLAYVNAGRMSLPIYWQKITTDAQGSYRIVDLPSNRSYYVIYNANGYGSAQQKVPEDEGNSISLPTIVLKKATLKVMGKVVDSSGAPLANANVHVNGYDQPDKDLYTDPQGCFSFDACEGKVSFTVWFQELQTHVETNAGETNLVVVIKPKSGVSEGSGKPERVSLVGRQLPTLKTTSLPSDAVPQGKPILLCLFESQQRPSRRAIRVMTEQYEALKQKGITVLALQTASIENEAFENWLKENSTPFKIGRITEKSTSATWATGTDSLPWFILANAEGRVIAEGFPVEDLQAKIGSLEK